VVKRNIDTASMYKGLEAGETQGFEVLKEEQFN
jgi:hypothetical protein